MILLPKYKTISLASPIAGFRFAMSGEFRIKKYNSMGQLNYDSGWFPNLITNNGMNICTTTNQFCEYCLVGTNGAAPAYTDTVLGTYLAQSNTNVVVSPDRAEAGSPNYEFWRLRVRRFAAGVGTGSWAELAMSPTSGNSNLFNRVNVSVTKLADEVVDVYFKLTYWPYVGSDVVFNNVDIGGTLYNTLTRGINYQPNDDNIYQPIGEKSITTSDWKAFDGALGAVTAVNPSGNGADGNTSGVNDTYTPGSWQRDFHMDIGLDEWNLGAGIRTVRVATMVRGIQTRFGSVASDATIPKTNIHVMEGMTWRLAWTRHSGS